jgi:octaprenyl-diphosphate synthase
VRRSLAVANPLLHSSRSEISATALVAGDLERVEHRIQEVIRSREPALTTISDYLINAGGKRIRPAVAMLVFRACGGRDVTDMVDLSVSLELIHTATLLHDDIIDSNDVRRGKDAAPVRFGIADTLVTGDFLFSRAFEVCGRFEPKIVAWAADACIQLTEGEIMQGRFRRNRDVTLDDYLEIINRRPRRSSRPAPVSPRTYRAVRNASPRCTRAGGRSGSRFR